MDLKERELKALWNAAYVIQEEKGGLSCPALKSALAVLTEAIWTPRAKTARLQMAWSSKARRSTKR
jgi:hypothetical protein